MGNAWLRRRPKSKTMALAGTDVGLIQCHIAGMLVAHRSTGPPRASV